MCHDLITVANYVNMENSDCENYLYLCQLESNGVNLRIKIY
jgi:hypothetical protein